MNESSTNQNDKNSRQKYVTPKDIYNELKQLWRN
jgi:hypothetical protein